VCWSWSWGLFRQDDRFTGRQANEASEGVPDASGCFIVSESGVMDINSRPSKTVFAKDFPGATDYSGMLHDHSGRYLLVSFYDPNIESSEISVRRFPDVSKVLFKIKFGQRPSMGDFMMISSTKTLVTPGTYGGRFVIYDLDCDALEKAMAAEAGNQ
jgi:hypothetical protein